MFGKKKVGGVNPPAKNGARIMQPPRRDSDGKRRVIGEAVYAERKQFLDAIGFDIDDPKNILPDPQDVDDRLKQNLAEQDVRRCKLEAELLAKYGVNNIRPFFVLAEHVMNSGLGNWLITVMELLPYDDWNLVYLPNDAATAAAMDLPLHPQQAISAIDELMEDRIGGFYQRFVDGQAKVDAFEGQDDYIDTIEQFLVFTAEMKCSIVDYVSTVKPMIVELIADVQKKAA